MASFARISCPLLCALILACGSTPEGEPGPTAGSATVPSEPAPGTAAESAAGEGPPPGRGVDPVDGGTADSGASEGGLSRSPGDPCIPTNPCRTGRVACSGGTTCEEAGAVADGTTCGAGLACQNGICKPGALVIANGTCTYREVPRTLSCPSGMSCQCYDKPWLRFKDAAAQLSLWVSETTLDVRGGTIPDNAALPTVKVASIPLTSGQPQTGTLSPYTVTVNGAEITVTVNETVGYVPEKSVLSTSQDCGHKGKTLQCTFHAP